MTCKIWFPFGQLHLRGKGVYLEWPATIHGIIQSGFPAHTLGIVEGVMVSSAQVQNGMAGERNPSLCRTPLCPKSNRHGLGILLRGNCRGSSMYEVVSRSIAAV